MLLKIVVYVAQNYTLYDLKMSTLYMDYYYVVLNIAVFYVQ